jgi:proteasome lid subunit RPN8/RPN11
VTAIVLPEALRRAIERHAREAYPDECCGFLIGPDGPGGAGDRREIVAVERATNEFDGERRRRFVIRPEEHRAIERRLDGTGRALVGFYHSHPDHPARPSEFDRDHAWPWYTYVVLAVGAEDVGPLGAFELDDATGAFREQPVAPAPTDASRMAPELPRA